MSNEINRPLNLNKKGCVPSSSNCVIWQGPDIPLLGLCKGASVTEVVYELAMQFVSLYEQLLPTSFNLDCLSIEGCDPKNINELLQLLFCRVGELGVPCNTSAKIAANTEEIFTVAAVGATGDLTYSWEVADNAGALSIAGANNQQTVTVSFTGSGLVMGLLKATVTDANGCVASDFYLATKTI